MSSLERNTYQSILIQINFSIIMRRISVDDSLMLTLGVSGRTSSRVKVRYKNVARVLNPEPSSEKH